MTAGEPPGSGGVFPVTQIPLYEQNELQVATQGALRPGGLSLTRLLLEQSQLSPGAKLLDMGCGCGASLNWLRARQYSPIGVDISTHLLCQALASGLDVTRASAIKLPYPTGAFDGLLFECSLSVISGNGLPDRDRTKALIDETLQEARRVLRPAGWLLISDVYARKAEGIPALRAFPAASCLRGVLDLSALQRTLEKIGFEIEFLEDHSYNMKTIENQLCQSYGSQQNFWEQAAGAPVDTFDLAVRIGGARPGYFALAARCRI